ncbi:MAG: SelB C-terminal domain-containing protein [Gemmatimonadota bacterium]
MHKKVQQKNYQQWWGLEEATRDLPEESGVGDWPIVPVPSVTGEGLDDLRESLRDAAQAVESRRQDDVFRMPVDRAFSIHGTGTVVTGTVWSGAVRSGETVRLLPGTASSRVRGLEVHGDPRGRVAAGRRCAVALVGVGAADSARGTVLVTHPGWEPATRLGVRIDTLVRPGRPVEHSQRIRVYVGTREVMARVATNAASTIKPGESGWAVLVLEEPLVARVRDRGIVRFYSPVTTIGGIRVCEIDPPREWAPRVEAWSAILDGDGEAAFSAAVDLTGARGLDLAFAPIALGLAPRAVEEARDESDAVQLGDRCFSLGAREDTMHAVMDTVVRLHSADRRSAGVSLESVRSALSDDRSPELVRACLERHLEAGTLQASGPRVSVPGSGATLTDTERDQLEQLRATLGEGGLQPPTVNDLGSSLRIERAVLDDLLRLLVEEGDARAVTPEIYMDGAAVDGAIVRVRAILANSAPASPRVFKTEFGLSRKYLIPLLEYLDRSGVTRRVAEGRVLAN